MLKYEDLMKMAEEQPLITTQPSEPAPAADPRPPVRKVIDGIVNGAQSVAAGAGGVISGINSLDRPAQAVTIL